VRLQLSALAYNLGNLARVRDSAPQTQPETKSQDGYPMREVLTANDIMELVEHRRMEPIFYISDNSEVKRQLNVPD
jgi:hypothetical protein